MIGIDNCRQYAESIYLTRKCMRKCFPDADFFGKYYFGFEYDKVPFCNVDSA